MLNKFFIPEEKVFDRMVLVLVTAAVVMVAMVVTTVVMYEKNENCLCEC